MSKGHEKLAVAIVDELLRRFTGSSATASQEASQEAKPVQRRGRKKIGSAIATASPDASESGEAVKRGPGRPKTKAVAAAPSVVAKPDGRKRGRKLSDIAGSATSKTPGRKRAVDPETNGHSKKKPGALYNLMVQAMLAEGNKPMKATDVLEALARQGNKVTASNPRNYVSFLLSKREDLFTKVSHGVYQAKKGARSAEA
jgi:hypothetical protein